MKSPESEQLLAQAVESLLLPLARLCVGRGLPFAQAEELFKHAYVAAAREARREQGAASTRDISQVAVATGLHRREVTRVGDAATTRAPQRPAPATQLVTRWLSDPELRHRNGRSRRLPRQGPAPSFEALAASITRHVHPRSLLDELLRRGLVELLDGGETVALVADRIAPKEDQARLYGFLAANAGDHLAAAVANVLHGDRRHFEQAIFSDSMSTQGLDKARELVRQQWQQMLQNLVPALQQMIDDDRAQGREAGHRIRIGLYSFNERNPEESDENGA
jgi:Family of unknown function (DUF6502)